LPNSGMKMILRDFKTFVETLQCNVSTAGFIHYSNFQVNRPRSRGARPCAPTTDMVQIDENCCNSATKPYLLSLIPTHSHQNH
jgi:hypothetical protein